MLFWLEAKPKHFEKYCSIYTRNNFDVLTVETPALNFAWPRRSQTTAKNVLKFLENNESYERVLVHGFSAGGYVWGECLVLLHANDKINAISKRIKGQVWDSIGSANEVPIGISNSLFPHNKFMELLLGKSFNAFKKVFYGSITKHHSQSEMHFNEKAVKAPTLIFGSKIDPIGTEKTLRNFARNLKLQNIDTTLNIFDDSPHVQHYQKYRDEYLKLLMEHLKKCQLIK